MPVFGYGLLDFVIFALPFLVVFGVKKITKGNFSVGAAGAVVVGFMCIAAQRVSVRYGVYYVDKAATSVGILFIVAGAVSLLLRHRAKPQK